VRPCLLALVLLFAAAIASPALADPPPGAVTMAAPVTSASIPPTPKPAAQPPPQGPLAAGSKPLPAPTPSPPALMDETRPLRFRAGVSLSGLGLLGIVLGSVLGARAIVDKNDIGAHCNRAALCDLAGYTLGSEAQDFALISTASFVVGLAAAGAGVGLLVSALPVKPGAAAWMTPGGLAVGGRW
jgi:hypothetical protein